MIHSRRRDNGDNFDTIQSQGIGIDGELGIDGGVSVECNAQICFQNLQTIIPIHQAAIVNVEP